MSGSVGPPPVTPVVAQINEWTWLRLPVRIGRWSLPLSGAFLDGIYLSAWPFVGACVLPIVLWLGLRMGWGQAATGTLYIYSLATMVILVLVSQHNAAIGLVLWCGYALGDLFYTVPKTPIWTWSAKSLAPWFGSHALADLVLGILLVVLPLVARALTRSGVAGVAAALRTVSTYARTASDVGPPAMSRDERLALRIGLNAAMEFALVYLWAQAAGLLLQPYSVWQGVAPTTHGLVIALRGLGWPLAAVAAYAGGVRIGLESAAATKPAMRARGKVLRESFSQVQRSYRLTDAVVLVPLKAVGLTFLLSGLIDNSQPHAVAVFLATAVILWARDLVRGYLGVTFGFIARVPVVVRVLVAVLISYMVATYLVRSAGADSFVPGLVGAVVSLAVCAVLLPGPRKTMPRRTAAAGTRP